ncbi:MAG: amidohydrolase family protein [Candidatus Hydrothermarchaeales archaeon]
MDSHVHLIAVDDLHSALDLAGVEKAFVIPSIRKGIENASSYAQLKHIISEQGARLKDAVKPDNSLVIELAEESDRLIPLAWINPLANDAVEEAMRSINKGARGIKLQPGFHGYTLEDEEVAKVVKATADFDVPVFVHTGSDVLPASAQELVERFQDVRFVLMHMGMYTHYTDAISLASRYDNVYLDTADPLPAIAVEIAIDQLGPERILMGSDFPFWGHPKLAVEKIKIATRDEKRREMIMGKNALKLVGEHG